MSISDRLVTVVAFDQKYWKDFHLRKNYFYGIGNVVSTNNKVSAMTFYGVCLFKNYYFQTERVQLIKSVELVKSTQWGKSADSINLANLPKSVRSAEELGIIEKITEFDKIGRFLEFRKYIYRLLF